MPIDYKNRKPRIKNNDTNLHIKIPSTLKIKLLDYSRNKKIAYSKIVRAAIENYIEEE